MCIQLIPWTEQHFLTQLQELGILSLTPARMVFGERIASHDDRYERLFSFPRWVRGAEEPTTCSIGQFVVLLCPLHGGLNRSRGLRILILTVTKVIYSVGYFFFCYMGLRTLPKICLVRMFVYLFVCFLVKHDWESISRADTEFSFLMHTKSNVPVEFVLS